MTHSLGPHVVQGLETRQAIFATKVRSLGPMQPMGCAAAGLAFSLRIRLEHFGFIVKTRRFTRVSFLGMLGKRVQVLLD